MESQTLPRPQTTSLDSSTIHRVSPSALFQYSSSTRLLFLSSFVTQVGFSLNLIASLSLLTSLNNEEGGGGGGASPGEGEGASPPMLPITGLLLLRLLPPLFVSPLIGGPLADKADKRQVIVGCDTLSAFAVLLFPLASHL